MRAPFRHAASMADPTRRAEMAQACGDVAETLSMDRHVEELLAVYAEVAAER